jgi:hypothetical protein
VSLESGLAERAAAREPVRRRSLEGGKERLAEVRIGLIIMDYLTLDP